MKIRFDGTKIAQGCALAAMALVALAPVSARADRDDWHHTNRGNHYGWNQSHNPHHRTFYQWQNHNSWYGEHKRIPLQFGDRDDSRRFHRDRDDMRNFDRNRDRDDSRRFDRDRR
jgi:hypothetical protein